jgi:hypothetical protein
MVEATEKVLIIRKYYSNPLHELKLVATEKELNQ